MEPTFMIPVSMIRMSYGEFISPKCLSSPFCPFCSFLNRIIWQGKRIPVLATPVKPVLNLYICLKIRQTMLLQLLCFFISQLKNTHYLMLSHSSASFLVSIYWHQNSHCTYTVYYWCLHFSCFSPFKDQTSHFRQDCFCFFFFFANPC